MKNKVVITLTGPSTAGKTVLSGMLEELGYEPLVSTTTRKPRQNESNGKDYYFVSHSEFDKMLKNNELIEHVQYHENEYGVTEKEASRAFAMNRPAILVAEPHGSRQIYDLCTQRGWDVIRIFVNNPTEVLIKRMLDRFHHDVKSIDLETEEGKKQYNDKLNAHGGRMNKILTIEAKEWVEPAYNGTAKYDLVIDEFGTHNSSEVLAKVHNLIEKRMGISTSPSKATQSTKLKP